MKTSHKIEADRYRLKGPPDCSIIRYSVACPELLFYYIVDSTTAEWETRRGTESGPRMFRERCEGRWKGWSRSASWSLCFSWVWGAVSPYVLWNRRVSADLWYIVWISAAATVCQQHTGEVTISVIFQVECWTNNLWSRTAISCKSTINVHS